MVRETLLTLLSALAMTALSIAVGVHGLPPSPIELGPNALADLLGIPAPL